MVNVWAWLAWLPIGLLALAYLYDRSRIRGLGDAEEAVWRARRSIATMTATLSSGGALAIFFSHRGLDYFLPLLFLTVLSILGMVGFSHQISRITRASRRAHGASSSR